ncbi:MAG: flagellar basal body-associated FliL family protein [Clostridiaceae bacterium]|nr:flagellar basal body-associated FliL family protein [Clostridiaceae bacterium]
MYTILLSIIAVLTLALAVMIIFIFTAFNTNRAIPSSGETPKPLVERVVPKEEQVEFKLYGETNEAIFNIKSTETHPNSFLMASISIIYDGGKKNKQVEERKELLNKNLSLLKQACIKYFMSQSYEDLNGEEAMDKARASLKDAFNEIVRTDDSDEAIIIDVVFDKWIRQ